MVRVVPAIPSFAVDAGFAYSVPPGLAVPIGSIVRVPLGGRRVRGFVVGVEHGDPSRLKPIQRISAPLPVFGPTLLEVLRWAAHHYVAPLAVLLERAAPPNLPVASTIQGPGALGKPVRVEPGSRPTQTGIRYRLGPPWPPGWIGEAAEPMLTAGKSVMLIVATGEEVAAAAAALPGCLAVHPDADDQTTTGAWVAAAVEPGRLLIGTPRITLWPLAEPGWFFVIEEGRRAMKERQTPTLAVRELVRRRAALEKAAATFAGSTPTGELIAAGVPVDRPVGRHRGWPLVEVVDRRQDPSEGLLGTTARSALRAVTAGHGRAFLFCHRRGYAAAVRCARCRQLRRCPNCGTRPDPGKTCLRCGAELGPCSACGGVIFQPLGAGVGRVNEELRRLGFLTTGGEVSVVVGTEADLAAPDLYDLTVAVDADGLMLGPTYRAAEESLRLLARLAGKLKPGSGRRLLVQTAMPDHPVIAALAKGDPLSFLKTELANRAAYGYPPAGEVIIVETRGEGVVDPDPAIRAAGPGVAILGPAVREHGRRWLVQGADLGPFRLALRPVVQRLRDSGLRVRIDVDPIDL